jgi:hypothetical protein
VTAGRKHFQNGGNPCVPPGVSSYIPEAYWHTAAAGDMMEYPCYEECLCLISITVFSLYQCLPCGSFWLYIPYSIGQAEAKVSEESTVCPFHVPFMVKTWLIEN